jgi:hypothetical protein
MSKKPSKRSDPKWMKPRRDRAILVQPDHHLIVTEGKKTEPNYFNGLKRHIESIEKGRYRGKIAIEIMGAGRNDLSLLQFAEGVVRSSFHPIRHVWLVYDRDDVPPDRFDNTCHRCNSLSGKDITYHALWSNQCVELWYLLHYCLMDSDIHREGYFPRLSAFLNAEGYGDYRKNREDMFEVLLPHLDDAMRSAKYLWDHRVSDVPSQVAPGTQVYRIFDFLKPYL